MSRRITAGLLAGAAALLLLPAAANPGGDPPLEYEPTYADASAVVLLSSARLALRDPEAGAEACERRLRCAGAIVALVQLYQLHGCRWALGPLKEVYSDPDCPDLHLAYSADGRLELRLEPLPLKNPAFADYTVYLCTLSSLTPLVLRDARNAVLTIDLSDGARLTAQQLTPEHPLWEELQRLADAFQPPPILPSGGGTAFKQLFAVPNLCPSDISTVSLRWGDYELLVPYFENEVGS